jgi:hypothetical protein
MEYIVVVVTSYFRSLASAPKVHWQAGAEAPALDQEPKPLLGGCSHNHTLRPSHPKTRTHSSLMGYRSRRGYPGG